MNHSKSQNKPTLDSLGPLVHKLTERLSSLAKKPDAEKIKDLVHALQGFEVDFAHVLDLVHENVRQLELLSKFSSLLNSTLDTSVVREKSLEATCELLGCETASLFLVDEEKNDLYFETVLGAAGKELKNTIRLPIDNKSIAGHVAKTGEKFVSNDVPNDPRHFKGADHKAKGKFKTKNMICIPLRTKVRLVGVLQALNKPNGFSPADLKLIESLGHQVTIAVENSQLYARLKKSFYDTVQAMVEAIEKKDSYTGGHTKRVVIYSVAIANHMGFTPDEMDRIKLAALLHDVGKIGIEDKILKKAAPLDPYEWPVMKKHPELGFEILYRVEGIKDVLDGMRFHHERFDGKDYPEGLIGDAIPLIARIVAVADTYDAMVSTRPYRKGLSAEIAYKEIVKNSGTQFCPVVVDAFKKAFHNDRMGKGLRTKLMPEPNENPI